MSFERVVYIGGFGNGQQTAERIGAALQVHFPEREIKTFSFSKAMQSPKEVWQTTFGGEVFTHSAGMVALHNAHAVPESIIAFSPPLPTFLSQFATRTIQKRVRMHTSGIGILTPEDKAAVKDYERAAVRELLTKPIANFRHLGVICKFDAVETAASFVADGVSVSLVYTEGDEYFQLASEHLARAEQAGVSVTHLAGVHDELGLRPERTLAQIFKNT